MDEDIRDRAAGRDEAADGSGNDSPASRDRESAGSSPAAGAENIVTVCAWCPQLHILKLQLRDIDVLIIYQQGKEMRILRNGVNLTISHGICEPCRVRMR